MAAVDVHLFAGAAHAFGTSQREVHADSLGGVLEALREDASDEARVVLSRCSFLVNSVAASDADAPLTEGDRVDVLPPFAGG